MSIIHAVLPHFEHTVCGVASALDYMEFVSAHTGCSVYGQASGLLTKYASADNAATVLTSANISSIRYRRIRNLESLTMADIFPWKMNDLFVITDAIDYVEHVSVHTRFATHGQASGVLTKYSTADNAVAVMGSANVSAIRFRMIQELEGLTVADLYPLRMNDLYVITEE